MSTNKYDPFALIGGRLSSVIHPGSSMTMNLFVEKDLVVIEVSSDQGPLLARVSGKTLFGAVEKMTEALKLVYECYFCEKKFARGMIDAVPRTGDKYMCVHCRDLVWETAHEMSQWKKGWSDTKRNIVEYLTHEGASYYDQLVEQEQ